MELTHCFTGEGTVRQGKSLVVWKYVEVHVIGWVVVGCGDCMVVWRYRVVGEGAGGRR